MIGRMTSITSSSMKTKNSYVMAAYTHMSLDVFVLDCHVGCLVFARSQPRGRSCCPKMASSCTCTSQRPWSLTLSTESCARTWANPSTTTSSLPRTTPTSWRTSSKGPAAQRLMSGNGFHPTLRNLCFEVLKSTVRAVIHWSNHCSLLMFIQLLVFAYLSIWVEEAEGCRVSLFWMQSTWAQAKWIWAHEVILYS